MSIPPRNPASTLLVALDAALPDSAPASESDIAALTAAIARGDEAAFREFHARFATRLMGYLFIVHRGDEHAARESWQATLVKAARRMRRFSSEHELWSWLATIARRTACDEHRRSWRLARLRERFAIWRGARESSPHDDGSEEAALERLQTALARVSAEDRALLEAKYLAGQSVRVIAEGSSRTEKAVESALTRARERLRAALLEELGRE